ncbi:MAG: formyl transferase [Ginsengibacter sp.]
MKTIFNQRVVILAGKSSSTNIVYNALKDDFHIECIILEDPVKKVEFLKKRIKYMGFWRVSGQVLFKTTIAKFLEIYSKKRISAIHRENKMDDAALPKELVIPVTSVNDDKVISLLQKHHPAIVVVNGTRIISKKVLNAIDARFVNIHAGITPKYRNVHGAYWALVNNDFENCGVTVHLVDPGIDTGSIIYQSCISVTRQDNFATYPSLQLAKGIVYLKKALNDIFDGRLVTKKRSLESKIWHHPTLGQYILNRLMYQKK